MINAVHNAQLTSTTTLVAPPTDPTAPTDPVAPALEIEYRSIDRVDDATFAQLVSHVANPLDWPCTNVAHNGRVWPHARLIGVCTEPKLWSSATVRSLTYANWLDIAAQGAACQLVSSGARELLASGQLTPGYLLAPHIFATTRHNFIQRGTSADMAFLNYGRSVAMRSFAPFLLGATQEQAGDMFDGASNLVQHVCADVQLRKKLASGEVTQAQLDAYKISHPWQHDIASHKTHGIALSRRAYNKYLFMIVPHRDTNGAVELNQPPKFVAYSDAVWDAVRADYARIEEAAVAAAKNARSECVPVGAPPPLGMVPVAIHDRNAEKKKKQNEKKRKRRASGTKRGAAEAADADTDNGDNGAQEQIEPAQKRPAVSTSSAVEQWRTPVPPTTEQLSEMFLHFNEDAVFEALAAMEEEKKNNTSAAVSVTVVQSSTALAPTIETFGEDAYYEGSAEELNALLDNLDDNNGPAKTGESFNYDASLMAHINSIYSTSVAGLQELCATDAQQPKAASTTPGTGVWDGFPLEDIE